MDSKCMMGVDVGTTGIKVIIYDVNGHWIADEYKEYPLICKHPGWAEQDPNQWWDAFKDCVQRLINRVPVSPEDIIAIGCTGQQPSPVLLDKEGNVLCNSLIWMDRRTTEECNWLQEKIGAAELYKITGLRPDPMYAIYKLLWIKKNQNDVFKNAKAVLQPKDYINFKLTGKIASDYASSAATQGFNLLELNWEPSIFSAAGISIGLMPEVYNPSHILGNVKPAIAEELKLSAQTVVVTGGGDTTVSALGCGIVNSGDTAIVIGTSSDVVTCVDAPIVDPKKRIGCYPYVTPGKYMTIAGANSSGVLLRWFRDEFFASEKNNLQPGQNIYDLMLDDAAQIPVGSEGLVFLPYFAGERSPIFNPNARGVFAGISLVHSKAHFIRAIVEGISLSIKDRLVVSQELGVQLGKIILTGGGARNRLWRQIITDMIGLATYRTPVKEAAGLGAAILASVGAGLHSSIEKACQSMTELGDKVLPNLSYKEVYDELYTLYKVLYKGNLEFFDQLARVKPTKVGEDG